MKRRRLFEALILLAGVIWVLTARSGEIQAGLSKRDFGEYWAGGQLLWRHQNPYAPTAFLAEHGITVSEALTLRMPPWSLPLVLPLGWLTPYGGWILWMAVSVASLILTIRWCWSMYGGEPGYRSRFRLIGYLFPPVLACLAAAQIGLLLMLGMVLFLKLERERPWLAGAALLLPLAKPHLLAPFWLVLLLWSIDRKKWAVLGGLAGATAAATGIALWFDPAAFAHYLEMLRAASIGGEFIPSLAGVLRMLFFRRYFWAQFVPLGAATAWCVWYYAANRRGWDWRRDAGSLTVVSLLATPYGWLTDESILLPAMLQASAWMHASKHGTTVASRAVPIALAVLSGLLLLLIGFQVAMRTGLYFWSSAVWALWYGYGRARRPE